MQRTLGSATRVPDVTDSATGGGRPTLVYIAGVRNSGTTLLDAVLGAAPGARSLGEVGGFARVLDGVDCDCGERAGGCTPCRATIDALEAADQDWPSTFRSALSNGNLRWLAVPSRSRRRYAAVAVPALDAVRRATGADVLVDSSKNLPRAAALLVDGHYDVRVVHIVRDPRGFIGSRRRRAEFLERNERTVGLLAQWATKNVLAATLLRLRAGRGYLRIRYEDLLRAPAETIDRLGEFAGLETEGLAQRAITTGVHREHLYEPQRRVDYSTTRLDPTRLCEDRWPEAEARRFWRRGGFVGRLFGYDRDQTRAT
jgi:hypothetical protein